MVFSSAIFIFGFLPLVYIVYRLLPGLRARNCFLALVSVVFYAFGLPRYVPLFLATILVNYLAGLALMGVSGQGKRKALLAIAMAADLGLLVFYKYTDFLIAGVNSLLATAIPLPGIILPIGISFFTFQAMSYTIDVYRDPSAGTRSFMKLLLYIAFFPQLIAGPIVKYHDISQQIDGRVCTPGETAKGIQRFILGLAKKLLIANAAGRVADAVFTAAAGAAVLDWRLAWAGGICYTLQIYYDFSGYSDMAIGMGHMFGFSFKENFLFPYGACSMTEFWQHWHVSLTSWFREYLYIPLGGNRRGKGRMVLNRFIVFLCTGIWHGANWTFIIWGLCHGALTSIERLGPGRPAGPARRVAGRVYTMLAVTLLFVVFRADSLSQAWSVISAMFSFRVTAQGGYLLAKLLDGATVAACLVAVALAGNLVPRLKARLAGRGEPGALGTALSCLGSLALLLVSLMCLSGGGFDPFIYFQF